MFDIDFDALDDALVQDMAEKQVDKEHIHALLESLSNAMSCVFY